MRKLIFGLGLVVVTSISYKCDFKPEKRYDPSSFDGPIERGVTSGTYSMIELGYTLEDLEYAEDKLGGSVNLLSLDTKIKIKNREL